MKVGRGVDEGDEIDDRGGCPRFDKVTKVCLRLGKKVTNGTRWDLELVSAAYTLRAVERFALVN